MLADENPKSRLGTFILTTGEFKEFDNKEK